MVLIQLGHILHLARQQNILPQHRSHGSRSKGVEEELPGLSDPSLTETSQ